MLCVYIRYFVKILFLIFEILLWGKKIENCQEKNLKKTLNEGWVVLTSIDMYHQAKIVKTAC